MESDTNWEDEILKKIRSSKGILTNDAENLRNKDDSNDQVDFNIKFNKVYSIITQTIDQLNSKLDAERINLRIVYGLDDPLSNRKAVQVVLKEDNTPVNLLENPYLLIEGFANNDEVRIVSSGSTDQGKIMDVKNIDSDVMRSELSDFIENSY